MGRPSMRSDCEIFADVRGREVTVTVEGVDEAGEFVQFSDIMGQVIDPNMKAEGMALRQIGPGRYRGQFQAAGAGSYMVNLRYRRAGHDGQTGLAQSAVTVPYAPEFRDLSDNTALLAEVADVSGGRVIRGDLSQVDFFQRSGLIFPRTAYPLTKPLFLIWLGLFLLDVAVRRIVLDIRAMARKLASAFRLPARADASPTLTRLRQQREKLIRQLSSKVKEPLASRKYQADDGKAGELPIADSTKEPVSKIIKPSEPTDKPAEAKKQETHLDRLLKAKRQATDGARPSDEDPKSGDKQNG